MDTLHPLRLGTSRPLVAQFRSLGTTLVLLLVVWAVLIGVVLSISYWLDVPFGDLTRDPADIFNTSFYIGFLSTAAIFLWAATAAVSLFAGLILPNYTVTPGQKAFLLTSGLLTMFLGADDAFLIHDKILPRIGVPETVTFAVYLLLVLLYMVRFRSLIFKTNYVLLGLSGIFFATSILVDVLQPGVQSLYLLEDAAKLAGILCWLAYFLRVAASAVSGNLVPRRTAAD